jgi:hypothetical protein
MLGALMESRTGLAITAVAAVGVSATLYMAMSRGSSSSRSSGSSGDAAFTKTLAEADKLLAELGVNRALSKSLNKEQFVVVFTDVLKELEFQMLQIQQYSQLLLQQYQVHRLDAQSRMQINRQINAATMKRVEEAIKVVTSEVYTKHGVDEQTMKSFIDANKTDPDVRDQVIKMNNISQGKYDCEPPEGFTKEIMLQYFSEKKEVMDNLEKEFAQEKKEAVLASATGDQSKMQAYRVKLSKTYKSQHECTQFAKFALLTNPQHKPEVILNCALQKWVKDPEFLAKMKPYLQMG